MASLIRVVITAALTYLLVGCASTTLIPTATPDVALVQFTELAGQALPLAQKIAPGAVLRQIDTDGYQTFFDFTDAAATQEITVWMKSPGAPVSQWQAAPASQVKLVDAAEPAIDLKSMQIGLSRVAQIITAYWPGCLVKTLTLYTQNNKPTWLGFCQTSNGLVSGMVDAQTGNLVVANAAPITFPSQVAPAP
jgi:hypothetical protein